MMQKHLAATALALILALQLPSVGWAGGGGGSSGSDSSSSSDSDSSSDSNSDSGNDDGGSSTTTDSEGELSDDSDDNAGATGEGTSSATNDDGELGGNDEQDDKAGTTGIMTSTPRDASEDAAGTRQSSIATESDNPIWGMRGDQVVGQTVYGSDGEEIGEIEDVVGGPSATRADAVVSVGGFLGIGDRNVVIPMNRIQSSGDRLTTDMTRAELEAMQPYDQSGYQPWERSRTLGGSNAQ